MDRRVWIRALAFTIAATAALAACSCSTDDDDPPPPTTEETKEEEVETAYLAFWDMFVRLAQAPDPNDPEIRQRASGEALANLLEGLSSRRDLGRRSEFGPQYSHDVLDVVLDGPDRATVTDCAVDDSRLIDIASNDVLDEGVVTELSEATLVRQQDSWLVDSASPVRSWEGKQACT